MTDLPLFDASRFQRALGTRAIGRFLLYRTTIGSTMDLARRELDDGAPSGTVVLAEEQTAGRGRQGRAFHSPQGENLYFTVVLRLDPGGAHRLPLAAPTAIAEACRELTGVDALIKWPNDIWIGDRKTCGALIDAVSEPAGIGALVGIGINVNGDPTTIPELREIATSLRRESGRPVDRELLLADICTRLESLLDPATTDLPARYRALSLVIERPVTVSAFGRTVTGTVASISDDGSLALDLDDGTSERFAAGEVSLRPRL